jgi:hypothetical protein
MTYARPFRLLALVLCVLAVPASSALAGRKAASAPSVSSLTPLMLRVGDTLTIRGHNFTPGRKRNSVVFKRDGGPAVVVKAGQTTRTRMKVVVPASLAKYLAVAGGAARPARFRIRVVAGRTSSKSYTALKRSPLIVPVGGPQGAVEQPDESDDGCDTDAVIEGLDPNDVGSLEDGSDAGTALGDSCSMDGAARPVGA